MSSCIVTSCRNHNDCIILDLIKNKPQKGDDCSYFKRLGKQEKNKEMTDEQKKQAIKERKAAKRKKND
jgi:hypothetical protein